MSLAFDALAEAHRIDERVSSTRKWCRRYA
jgi:hypothetical protein